jgi:hypothetical protein
VTLTACSGGSKRDAYVTFFTGTVSVSRSGKDIPVQVKTPVLDGDTVSVGNHSFLMIQSDDGLVIRVEANTQAEIRMISNERKREVFLLKGRVLSMVGKLQKANGYQVMTPTTVAAVRGTQFLTEFNGKSSVIAVSDGRVNVTAVKNKDETLVEKGGSAVLAEENGSITLRGHNQVEILELSKIGSTPVVHDISSKKPDEIRALFSETPQKEEAINSRIEDETGLSPERMKTKYGRVDVLTLYTGQVIQGVIVSRGEKFKVLTSSGAVFIDAKDVNTTDTRQ